MSLSTPIGPGMSCGFVLPRYRRLLLGRRPFHERNQFFENQGRVSALTEARGRVASAYSNAQQQMAGVSLDINKYLAQLEDLMESNERSAEEVARFFETSKEILKIHDKIMSIEPPQTPTIQP